MKSLVCRNSTQFHIESLRKLNYCICTYGKRHRFFLFFTGSFFYPTINILDIFMFYIKLFDKFSILMLFSYFPHEHQIESFNHVVDTNVTVVTKRKKGKKLSEPKTGTQNTRKRLKRQPVRVQRHRHSQSCLTFAILCIFPILLLNINLNHLTTL